MVLIINNNNSVDNYTRTYHVTNDWRFMWQGRPVKAVFEKTSCSVDRHVYFVNELWLYTRLAKSNIYN